MDFSLACNIVEWMGKLGAMDCLCIGGEPTLYPQLAELIRIGSNHRVDFKLVTNGRKLADTDYLTSLMEAGLKHASISIEGATAEGHNGITKTKSFDEVMQAIRNARDHELSFNTLLTVSWHTYEDIVPLATMLHEEGVQNILFNIGLPSPETPAHEVESFVIPPHQMATILTDAFFALKEKGIKVKYFATIPLCLFDKDIMDEMIALDYVSDGTHCHIYYGSGVAFEPDGNVLPCTHFVGHPLFNLRTEQISSAEEFATKWYGEEGIHGTFKEALWRYPHENCKECEHWGKCIGGCPFLWTHFNPQDIIGRKEVSNV